MNIKYFIQDHAQRLEFEHGYVVPREVENSFVVWGVYRNGLHRKTFKNFDLAMEFLEKDIFN